MAVVLAGAAFAAGQDASPRSSSSSPPLRDRPRRLRPRRDRALRPRPPPQELSPATSTTRHGKRRLHRRRDRHGLLLTATLPAPCSPSPPPSPPWSRCCWRWCAATAARIRGRRETIEGVLREATHGVRGASAPRPAPRLADARRPAPSRLADVILVTLALELLHLRRAASASSTRLGVGAIVGGIGMARCSTAATCDRDRRRQPPTARRRCCLGSGPRR